MLHKCFYFAYNHEGQANSRIMFRRPLSRVSHEVFSLNEIKEKEQCNYK